MNVATIVSVLVGYLLGCFNAAYYFVRWKSGRDIRQFGSGNAGARNAGRLLGKGVFLVTLLIDMIKGMLAIWLALQLSGNELTLLFTAIAVTAGHIWPVQLRFQGGKGIAVYLGVLLALEVHAILFLLALFTILYLVTRRFTISGLTAIAFLPFILFAFRNSFFLCLTLLLMGILVLWAHRMNIREEVLKIRGREDDE